MSDIKSLRQEIDSIDNEIKSLFIRRMDTVSLIAILKSKSNISVPDTKREEEIIAKNTESVSEELKPYYEKLLRFYIELSKEYQEEIIKG